MRSCNCVRTTFDLPDELFRQAKAKAALEGTKLKDLITRFIEAGLRQPTSPSAAIVPRRSKFPVIRNSGKRPVPSLKPRLQARLDAKEDLAKLRRSFGR